MSISLDQVDPNVLLLIAPLVLLELGLLIAAIADLLREDRAVRGNNKGLWAVVIILVNASGVPLIVFEPSASMRCFTSGARRLSVIASFRRLTISEDVPAGARIA